MQRNEITTLGNLRLGDRFCYLKRVDVWQVMGKFGDQVQVNQVVNTNDGKTLTVHQFNDIKKSGITVKFVRHTVPVFGEEILLMDLKEGDCFYIEKMKGRLTVVSVVQEPYYWMQSVRTDTDEIIQLQKSDVVTYAGKWR